MVHTFSPSTLEIKAGKSMQLVPGEPRSYVKILTQKKKRKEDLVLVFGQRKEVERHGDAHATQSQPWEGGGKVDSSLRPTWHT